MLGKECRGSKIGDVQKDNMDLAVIQRKIYELRGQKVMLDYDLSELYETETKYLKRTVRQNIKRFPSDFMFELNKDEWETLRCNFSTSNSRGGTRYMPFAFTEQGVAMLSGVLNSDKAVNVNIAIMRAFTALRHFALTYTELAQRLEALEARMGSKFTDVYEALDLLLNEKSKEIDWNNRNRIGFKKENP